MILRPRGIVQQGELKLGYELVIKNRTIVEVRPHTGVPQPFVVSPAFVNAHSHLEYRGYLDVIPSKPFWEWISDLVKLKVSTDPSEAVRWAQIAAFENRKTGVALIGEHSDFPVSGDALRVAGIDGTIFQETITLQNWQEPESRFNLIAERALEHQLQFGGRVYQSPHAPYSVDPASLARLLRLEDPISIHVAESPEERDWITKGTGPIQEMFDALGIESPRNSSSVNYLNELGVINSLSQLVHCCTITDSDIEIIADKGASVAHCPRSNRFLHCPIAPIRRLLDRGVAVGLGLDSPASGGPIDMFAEMRAAHESSLELGEALTPEEIWWMATGMGATTLGVSDWDIQVGSTVPLIAIQAEEASSTEDLIARSSPEDITVLSLV